MRALYINLRGRIALRLGVWSLKTIYGECETDVADDFPGEGLICIGCEATKMIKDMREMMEALL